MDSAQKEISPEQRYREVQQKIWERKFPHYITTIPYNCTVIAKQYACTMFDKKEDRICKKMPQYEHTMHANKYSIQDAQQVILSGIRDYTRDYSKRKDGQLNPDQLIECTVRFGAPVSCEHTFDICVGDAWQVLEKTMKDHLESYFAELNKEKK